MKDKLQYYSKIFLKYKVKHILALLLMILKSILSIVMPFLLIRLIDKAIPEKNINLLMKLLFVYLISVLLQNLLKLLSDYLYTIIGKRVVYDLRTEIVTHLQKLSGAYYSQANSGDLLTVINDDVAQVEEFFTKMLCSILSDFISATIMLLYLGHLQLDLLIASILLQPLLFILQKIFTKKMSVLVNDLRNTHGTTNQILGEYLASMLGFVINHANEYLKKKFYDISKKFLKTGIQLQLNLSLSMFSSSMISSLITITILGYGGYKVIIGSMTIGTLVAFNTYVQQLLSPVFRLAQLKLNLQQTEVALKRIYQVVNEPIVIIGSNQLYQNLGKNGMINFKNVSFSYDNQRDILIDMNLTFPNGKVTAIVGSSGSGKTTLIYLLLRLWNPNSGCITINDIELSNYELNNLITNISVVSQDVLIFDDSIFNNMTLLDENITMEKVIEISKYADIYNFIMSLPNQFNTKVGTRGVTLSGGQKQKISIARAMLRNSDVIVLDEATSSLDNISEAFIKDNLFLYFKEKIVIVIAHRLSTIVGADNIYVLNNGHVHESGTHQQLMDNKDIYYNMYIHTEK